MKIFKDRKSAGKLLADYLKQYKGMGNVIVLAIPRGGVVVAAEIAKDLDLAFDIVVTRKIGAPTQPELALGAVDPDGEVVWDNKLLSELRLKIENLKLKINEEMQEITRRESMYRQGKEPLNVENRVVILVDDGIATGATTISAINYLKRHQVKKIILAVPVGSKDTISKISRELGKMGKVIVLETPAYFQAVGQFYKQFLPVSDDMVIEILRRTLFAQDDNKD